MTLPIIGFIIAALVAVIAILKSVLESERADEAELALVALATRLIELQRELVEERS